jgi:hypothetical protein
MVFGCCILRGENMEKKFWVIVILILAILVGAWFIPVWEGKNVYELLIEKLRGKKVAESGEDKKD